MKAEPREYAAWRTFGMLSAEEQEAFDAAAASDPELSEARGRVEVLAAVISLTQCRPVAPEAGSLAIIKERCGLSGTGTNVISRARLRSLLAWAGWGVAAALAVLLAVRDRSGALTAGPAPEPLKTESVAVPKWPGGRSPGKIPRRDTPLLGDTRTAAPADSMLSAPAEAPAETPANTIRRKDEAGDAIAVAHAPVPESVPESGEKRRLIQEITTLRSELARSRLRDEIIFSPAPGRSWPLIVEMKPPSAVKSENDPPLSSQIADALAGKSAVDSKPSGEQKESAAATPQVAVVQVSAIPVYDPARDTGTLAIRNLPAVDAGSQYNLWVSTASSGEPVFVGTLPENLHSTDSLDFSLGSTGIVPVTYYLTLNGTDLSPGVKSTSVDASQVKGSLVSPNASNIVLQGP